jgi:hypothetical protein
MVRHAGRPVARCREHHCTLCQQARDDGCTNTFGPTGHERPLASEFAARLMICHRPVPHFHIRTARRIVCEGNADMFAE